MCGRRHAGLEFTVFEHRFDDQVATGQVGILPGGLDPRQGGVSLLGAQLATGNFLVQQRRRMGLALLGRRQADVLEHHVYPGHCADIGNPGAHHAGTQHPELFRHVRRKPCGARTTGVDFVELEPKGADHVFRHLAGGQFGEITGLNQLRGVEINLGALDRRTEDFLWRRHATLGLAAQDRRCDGQHLRDFRVRWRATRDLVALHIPTLHRRRVGENPGPGLGQQFSMIRRQFIDQPGLQGLRRSDFLAFEQVRQRLFQAQHAHHAHHPATARQQAEGHFRQPDLHRAVVQGHTVMAGQADLPATPQRCTIDRRYHRFAEGFQGAQLAFKLQHTVVEGLGFRLANLDQFVEIAAGKEGFFPGGDDHPGDGILVGQQTLDAVGHGLAVHRVHGVGALARHVDGQDHNPVRPLFVTNGISHEQVSLKSGAQ
ncbi:hypothetical protein D3C85_979150 [compost metagenome]